MGCTYRFDPEMARKTVTKRHDLGPFSIEQRQTIDSFLIGEVDDLGLTEDFPERDFWMHEICLLKEQLPRDLISDYLIN